MTSTPPWGPAYWEQNFGISSEEEFKERTSQYFPDFQFSFLPGLSASTLTAAYYQPYAPLGIYLASRLSSDQLDLSPLIARAQALILPSSSPMNPEITMPTLIIPNAFQVSIQASSGGHVVDNVVGVVNAGGTAAGAAAAVKAAWEASGGPCAFFSSLYVVNNYHAVDLSSAFGSIADVASTRAGSVTATNSLATMGACALVQWNGATRSRSTRGRLYYGPIMESDINPDGRTLTTGSRSAINSAISVFRSSLSTAGYPLNVLSRKLSQAFPVTSNATESVIATQRRRIR